MSRATDPAYPLPDPRYYADTVRVSGLTKLEYFSGLAMQGMCASFSTQESHNLIGTAAHKVGRTPTEHVAFRSIEIARALLAELDEVIEPKKKIEQIEGV